MTGSTPSRLQRSTLHEALISASRDGNARSNDRASPDISLTMTYFHTGIRTIIGAESFHGPVRDGKGWDRLAMVMRHNLYRQMLPIGQQYLESGRSSFG